MTAFNAARFHVRMPTEILLFAVGRYAKGSYLLRVRVSYLVAMHSNKAMRVKRKRAQSAMEYLTTYGWAILIIAVILVAFFALGVFNGNAYSPKAQPGSCSITRNQYGGASESGVCTNEMPEFVAQFGGTENDYIEISNQITINVNQYGYTVSAWIYTTKFDSSDAQAIFKGVSNNYAAFGLSLNSPGQDGICGWVDGICGSSVCGSETLVDPNQWYFVTGVWFVGTTYAAIYVNGKFIGNCAGATNPYSGTSQPEIASGPDVNGYNTAFQGYISNVQIYDSALSANDISALYQEGIGGPPINLQSIMGWWPLNGNSNDYSGYGNDGTPANIVYSSNWYSSYAQP